MEVADFDFGQVEAAPYGRFLDRLRDAVSSSVTLRGRRGVSCCHQKTSPLLSGTDPSNLFAAELGTVAAALILIPG